MQVKTLREITESLKAEGIEFRTFEMVSEGEYTLDDADWNYKTAPTSPMSINRWTAI